MFESVAAAAPSNNLHKVTASELGQSLCFVDFPSDKQKHMNMNLVLVGSAKMSKTYNSFPNIVLGDH